MKKINMKMNLNRTTIKYFLSKKSKYFYVILSFIIHFYIEIIDRFINI